VRQKRSVFAVRCVFKMQILPGKMELRLLDNYARKEQYGERDNYRERT
jgi:hypothetical protein